MTEKDFVWRDNYSRNSNNEEVNVERHENANYEAALEANRQKLARFLKITAAVLAVSIILLTVLIFNSRNLADKNIITSKLDQAIEEMERERRAIATQNASPQKTPPTEQKEPEASTPKVHKVLPGESLARISRYYGLTVHQLREYNNLESDSIIHPGDVLRLTPP